MHNTPHPYAGRDAVITATGATFTVEDWWDRVSGGQSWSTAAGHPACMAYGWRAGLEDLPADDEVVYGKSEHGIGCLRNVSELTFPDTTC